MKRICIISIVILFFWFSMDMTGFSIGGLTLVESAWNSIDGVIWLIFLGLSILFIFKEKIGKYMLTIFVLLWAVIQFVFHWRYTLFGASEQKIISYNRYFKETYHIIPESDKILIPDLYHIVLFLLIIETLICLILFLNNKRGELN